MKILKILAIAAFLVALPLALVMTNARWTILNVATYENGFARYGAARTTGMSQAELHEAAQQIIAYFDSGQPITLQIRKERGTELIFNQREMTHMVDVRNLFQRFFRVQELAVLYVFLFAAFVLLRKRPHPLPALARYCLTAGALTLAVFAAVGVTLAVAFDRVFLQFHLVSFSNDFWQLDPRTDYLIRMFPQGFWFENVLRVAVWSMAESAILVGLAWGYLRWRATRA